MASLVQPKENDRIYDPTCGSGGLLLKAYKKVPSGKVAIYGQELNAQTWALCTMNMFLHGVDDARIWQGDTLSNPQNVEDDNLMKFQVVVANPPFSLDKWDSGFLSEAEADKRGKKKMSAELDQYHRFDWGVPPTSKGDYAFVLHMLSSLDAENGRMAVVLPHGVLFRGASEGKIRRQLVEMNLLDAVIGLPANLFYGTGIPACILVFKKNRTYRDVLFIDASGDGNFEKGKNQNILRDSDITRIVNAYQARQNEDKYSYVASFDEIKENDFNLNIPRYVDTLMELSDCNPKVVVVTDRKELDRQIAATFAHTRLNPARATSGRNLVELLNSGKADVVTTIINKFNTAEKMEHKNFSRDVFLLVDESHRSNYGLLATKMRTVFPNACYIGFTGTPLMKKEKNTMAKFGKLIHKYTIKDGVDDGAIVPLIYEGRFVEQNVDEANIDLWFKQTTKRLTEAQRDDLSRKWSSIRRLTSTDARIKRIALDINEHFIEGYKDTGFKAMLATNYKRDAIRYLECFEQFGDLNCAVVISPPDLRESVDDIDEGADDKVIAYWNKMMNRYGDADAYEEAMKNQFCAGDIDILIVCSKLLTGFDAPICQVLYIDKELKEHGLLQAIARTNRLYEGKDYGLIVDYRGLIEKLDTAMDLYSGAGLENFDSGDLKGVVVDVMSSVAGLREAYTRLTELFADLKNPRDTEEVEVFLADDKKRENFYNFLCAFGKALNMVLNAEQAYAAIPKDELKQYQNTFIFFSKVRRSVKIRYCDAIDNREYEPLMQNLLDTHLSVAGLKQITSPIDILNKDDFERELEELGSLRAKADAITSKLTRSISEKYQENPAYYDSFSKRIKDALEQYKEKVISEAEYLAKMRTIMEDYHAGKSTVTYPESIKNNVHAQAFYGVLSAVFDEAKEAEVSPDFVAEIAEEITKIVANHSQVDWTNNKTIHDRISQDIDDLFYDYEKERGLKLGPTWN